MAKITTIGLDIAEHSFAAHGFDEGGRTALKKELRRGQVLAFFAKHEGCLVFSVDCSLHHMQRATIVEVVSRYHHMGEA